MQELKHKLISDLKSLGFTINFNLCLKGYSKTFFGYYKIDQNKIVLFVYQDSNKKVMYPYCKLLLTAVHEAIHCRQWKDPDYVRVKGVMHDPEFKKLYSLYSKKALRLVRTGGTIC